MATASDATGALGASVRSMTAAVRNMGLAMTVGSGIAAAALVGLTQSANQVSAAFREVDTISNEVADAQEEYGQLVSDLNTEFGLQADRIEVIDGLYQSISASIQEGEKAQREFLETAAQLAVVGQVDLATSVDVLSTVLNTYGMEAEEAEGVSESLFQTVQFGKVRMEELAPVLGRVAALGSNLNVQIDEIGASMAVLTRTGFGARVAATGLRNIFRAMLRPSEQMQETLFDIAAEQNFFAQTVEDSTQKLQGLASQYQDTSDAIDEYTKQQSEARAVQESSSTAIQEARLKIEAIEEDRLEQLPKITNAQVQEAESVSELESVIDDYQFKVNKARLEEERFRRETEEAETKLSNLKAEITDVIGTSGNLESGIGQLVLNNQSFIQTLTDLRSRVDETDTSFSDLFPRTRALQGALALVGEDGEALTQVFKNMEKEGFSVQDSWENLDESARKNFNSFEEFKGAVEDAQTGDLQKWYQQATGNAASMRNAVARLREVVQDLGAVFNEEVIDAIQVFTGVITTVSDKAESLQESTRENIAQFAVLATSVGLVLGPLLLIGGQLAMIASTLSVGFLPLIATAVGAVSLFAFALSSVVEGGEDAEGVIGSLQGTFDGLIDFLKQARQAFVVLVLPELRNLGEAFSNVFGNIQSDMEGFGGTSILFNFAAAIGRITQDIADFLNANSALIASLVRGLADVVVNRVIPALVDFAKGALAVIVDINWTRLAKIAGSILIPFALAVVEIVGIIGRWLQRNSELIGSIITWAAIIGSAAVAGFKLISAIGSIVLALSSAWAIIQTFTGTVYFLVNAFGALGAIKAVLIGMFPKLAAGISVLLGPVGILIGLIALLVAAWATDFANAREIVSQSINFIIQLFWLAVDAAMLVPRLIIAAWNDGFSGVKKVLGSFLGDLESLLFDSGKNLVQALAKGMNEAAGSVASAAKGVVNKVKNFLGFGSAPPALGEDYNPKKYGGNVSTSFAEGMEGGIGDVEDVSLDIADASRPNIADTSKTNVEDDWKLIKQGAKASSAQATSATGPGSFSGMGGGVTIKEKAVFFEKGAFQGVSDEELPRKVRDVVDSSMDEIIDELDARGIDTEGNN